MRLASHRPMAPPNRIAAPNNCTVELEWETIQAPTAKRPIHAIMSHSLTPTGLLPLKSDITRIVAKIVCKLRHNWVDMSFHYSVHYPEGSEESGTAHLRWLSPVGDGVFVM